MAGPSGTLLSMIAQGAQPRLAEAGFQGYRQGNAMLQAQQAQADRNALAKIAQAYGSGGPEAARSMAGQLGQLQPTMKIDNTLYGRGLDAQKQEIARQRLSQPMSGVGKLRADFDAGRIDSDEFRTGLQALQSRVGGLMTVSPGSTVLNRNTGQPIFSAPAKPVKLSPSERKAKRESENNLLNLDATVGRLNSALSLVDNAFSGVGAGARGYLGTNLPDVMVDDRIADPERAKATRELQGLLNLEAVQTMAQTLAGATTDFEMQEFKRILADPTAPPDLKRRTINRMLELAQKQANLERERIQEFNGEAQPQGRQEMPQSATGTGNTQDEQNIINMAIDALNKGADPIAVRQRLEQYGVDPAVLD
jgi:hypothetical protein